ncbi:hypothetical protein [Cellulosimicrobium sp. Marseille-Q4280]|uniref:hypothetical protein n=1 Tax=Cellulosimicrobium sp. Marseille-Q4280 TaxID=2937992 RepID=UPI00203F0761|nr:hypothetical protein [Cellulosimicrobium sp. Marseille-Q4280]
MTTQTRRKRIGLAVVAALTAALMIAPPAQAATAPITIHPGASITFVNNCEHRVGVVVATNWKPTGVIGVDESFVLGVGERRSFRNLQPTQPGGTLYGVLHHIAADGNGSAIIKEGRIGQTYAAQAWFACGIPGFPTR